MSALAELQQRFADALYAPEGAVPGFDIGGTAPSPERMDIYRRAIFANYRKALAATYPTVQRILGDAVFTAVVDAYVRAHPSASGDLNDYGDTFGAFLAQQPAAARLPQLPDLARLEWAIDEVNRAADAERAPDAVLGALAAVPAEQLPVVTLELTPSCRLIASRFPIFRIWQANQPGYEGDERIDIESGGDLLLVRRDPGGIGIERLAAGEFAWLAALAAGAALGPSIDAACRAEPEFDFARALHAHIGATTIVSVDAGRCQFPAAATTNG
jgi:hypothetical protein